MDDFELLLRNIVDMISLSETAKKQITKEYESLAMLFDKSNLDVDIKYQGSYALGTAIKPLKSEENDYDIDLVVILENYTINNPRKIKEDVGNVLMESKLYRDKVTENRRSWTVSYYNSHVDVLPSIVDENGESDIIITDNKEGYRTLCSSPFRFKNWFLNRGMLLKESSQFFENQIEHPKDEDNNADTLKAIVKLIKFHRDAYFEDKDSELKPISMLITILAAEAFEGGNNFLEEVKKVVSGMRKQIDWIDGRPYVYNPIDINENFTDKWDEYPEREEAFWNWLEDMEATFSKLNISKLKDTFGNLVTTALIKVADNRKKQSKLISPDKTMIEFGKKAINGRQEYREHTFYGDNNEG